MAKDPMTPQTPAQGILLNRDYGDAKQYEVVCECGDSGHSHNVWVEADDHNVTVTVYTTAKSQWWSKSRWSTIWTLLTKGYVKFEADIIMNSQQALNYSNVLASAVRDVESFRTQHKEKSAVTKLAEQGDCL